MWLEKRPKVGEDGLMSYEDSVSIKLCRKIEARRIFFDSEKQTSEEARGKKKGKRTGNSVVSKVKKREAFSPEPVEGQCSSRMVEVCVSSSHLRTLPPSHLLPFTSGSDLVT
jgi:hypothetical protein